MRSKAALLPKKEMIRSSYREGVSGVRTPKFGRNSPKKPSLLSKRSVSLPTDLQNTTVKTRKLFWFIPAGHRHQRRRQRCDSDIPQQENVVEIPGFDGEQQQQQQIQNGFLSPNRPLSHDIPTKAALEWISTSSTHSLSDSTTSEGTDYCHDDDDEGSLLGLEFIDTLRD